MNLHKNIFYSITIILFYVRLANCLRNKELLVAKSGVRPASSSSVGLQLYSVLNNTADEDYFVELISDQCCILAGESLDCDSVEIIGECSQVVQKGNLKTFTLVAPVLDPFERKGYCVIHLDSRPLDKRDNIMRNTIKIDFDTGLSKENDEDFKENVKPCENLDEDPFNQCKPVNCDIHYNGKKPIFDRNTRRCTAVPNCNNKTVKNGNSIYDPITNRCVDGELITSDDIDNIKSINKDRLPKDVIIIESNASPERIENNATLSEYGLFTDFVDDTVNETKAKMLVEARKQYDNCTFRYVIGYLMANKYTLLVLAMIIVVQCCLICTMIYCLTRKPIHSKNKKLERKYFNYRQDVSVTTPLIATSNIDTETTAFDYISESSNIDKKIKWYKACQKENNDAKTSLSDDILSKCLNRRDWNAKPKSDTKEDYKIANVESIAKKSKLNEVTIFEKPTKETEEKSGESEGVKEDFRTIKEDYDDKDSSEKLIQCHDYNFKQSRRPVRTNDRSEAKIAPSISTEKGAQACFSNDSMDDFLSERGMMFLAGETLSKYSFTSSDTPSSEISGKTSKNNIVKNVLSYFSKKSKIYTSSDPGKKLKNKDLELIHLSRASVYSSSASDFKNIKGVTLPKESRSSF